MRGFLYRDLCFVKRQTKFVGIVLLWFGVMAVMGRTPYGIQLLLPYYCVLMYVNPLAGADERNGWMAFASVVPNGRREIVKSKYIIVGLTAGVALLLEVLLAGGLAVMGKQDLLFSLQISLVAVGVAVLMAEISLPAEYTFGYRDGAFFQFLWRRCCCL